MGKRVAYKGFLITIYGGGLRVNVVVRIQPHHIESSRTMIRVE